MQIDEGQRHDGVKSDKSEFCAFFLAVSTGELRTDKPTEIYWYVPKALADKQTAQARRVEDPRGNSYKIYVFAGLEIFNSQLFEMRFFFLGDDKPTVLLHEHLTTKHQTAASKKQHSKQSLYRRQSALIHSQP